MSRATAIPGHTKDEPLAKRRRFNLIKAAIAALIALLLMYAGLQGRQHARMQAKLEDITMLRDHLQRRLDEGPAPNSQIVGLAGGLKTRLREFDAKYNPRDLSEPESLELRLSKATLANAERRFADALMMVTEEDEKAKRASTEADISQHVRVLQIRGDAFFGVREWPEALTRYQQVLTLQSNRIAAIARVADCLYALGRREEALASYRELARHSLSARTSCPRSNACRYGSLKSKRTSCSR